MADGRGDEPPPLQLPRPQAGLKRGSAVERQVCSRQVDWRTLAANHSLWFLAVSYGAVGYVEYLLIYWLERYLKTVMHFSTAESRFAAMLPMLCMAACMSLGGWLSDRLMHSLGYRWVRASVALAGMTACAAFLFASTFAPSPGYSVAAFTLALAAIGIAEAPAWATADLGGKQGATSAAVVNTGGNTGGLISPALSPWLVGLLRPLAGDAGGWAWALRLGAVICLLGGLLWLRIDASERAS